MVVLAFPDMPNSLDLAMTAIEVALPQRLSLATPEYVCAPPPHRSMFCILPSSYIAAFRETALVQTSG